MGESDEVKELRAALAEAKQEAADNEADYQGLARLIEEAGYPHLRAMIQALEDAKESSRRDNHMAAMAEIKIAEARKRAEAAEGLAHQREIMCEQLQGQRDEARAKVAELERERDLWERRARAVAHAKDEKMWAKQDAFRLSEPQPEDRNRFQCAARGCDGCTVCEPQPAAETEASGFEAAMRHTAKILPNAGIAAIIAEWDANAHHDD